MVRCGCMIGKVIVVHLFIGLLAMQGISAGEFPETEKRPVSDTYYNIDVVDNYRWLENYEQPAVEAWSDVQNNFTRDYLDNIAEREAIKRRLTEIQNDISTEYYDLKYRNGLFFAMKKQPPLEQPLLVVFESLDDLSTEKVIVDLNKIDTAKVTTIDFYKPTKDGHLVAVSFSKFGSELGDVEVYDVKTGQRLSDVVPRVNGPTAGGDVAWLHDNSGFYYTRYPHPGERDEADMLFYQQVYFHTLGTPYQDDTYEVGNEFPRIAEIELDMSTDGNYVLATIANGDGGEFEHYLKNQSEWKQITACEDLIPKIVFGKDENLYYLDRKNKPNGEIKTTALNKPVIHESNESVTIVPENDFSIKDFKPAKSGVFVNYVTGGPNKLYFYQNAETKTQIATPELVSINNLTMIGTDSLLFKLSSYTEPTAWFVYLLENEKITGTSLRMSSSVNFDDIEVRREFAVSKDGTKVPMSILIPKGAELDGNNPTILYGYGGYGICLSPGFNPTLRLWFDQGGIYVIANLRGGGEFGEEWHLSGNLTNKQNVFDDFTACAKYLIAEKYTNSEKLVIRGGSNGGLLMGAALTQHPELYRAVVSSVGLYDMLRVELDPNGEFNITEFGTVKNKDHFDALYGYSPYHRVKMGTAYPSVLFLTGEHDGRVNPAHSRKMTALLQSATSSNNPILLRTNKKTGHGHGTALSEQIEYDADIYSFIINELKIPFTNDR